MKCGRTEGENAFLFITDTESLLRSNRIYFGGFGCQNLWFVVVAVEFVYFTERNVVCMRYDSVLIVSKKNIIVSSEYE